MTVARMRKMVLNLQVNIDFGSLVTLLIKHKKKYGLLLLLDGETLRKRYKRRAVLLAFNECLRKDELAVALQIWTSYKELMKD